MPHLFYIQAVRSGQRFAQDIVAASIVVRSEDLLAVKRQARMLAQTATDPAWNWPAAQAIRVLDETGGERFRCWCRVALRLPKARQPPVPFSDGKRPLTTAIAPCA